MPARSSNIPLQSYDYNAEGPLVVLLDDIPGLQISILSDQLPQSVFDLGIMQLIAFIQQYQTSCSNSQQLADVLDLLEGYRSTCSNLQYIQLIYPWYGALPSIDIKIDSKVGWSAKMQLSYTLAKELIQYIRHS